MSMFDAVSGFAGLPVPLPKITRMGEVRNPSHPPVPAVKHLANRLPTPADAAPSASDIPGHTEDTECPCGYIGDMPVVGDTGSEVELRCPTCRESLYMRVAD